MQSFTRSLARRGLFSLFALIAFGVGPGAFGSGPDYSFHYAVTGAYADSIDLEGAPIERDVVMFYQHRFGLYPRINWETGDRYNGGLPHLADLRGHFTKCVDDIIKAIPDAAWDGFAVIDYESWTPWWDDTPKRYREAMIEDIRSGRPELTDPEVEAVARETYEQAGRMIYEGTIELGRALRPNARWGYWAYPKSRHANIENTQWLWDASDAFYPDVYMKNYLVPDNVEPKLGQAGYSTYISSAFDGNLGYARLVAGDSKPVLAFAWPRYRQSNANQWYRQQFLEQQHLQLMLAGPYFWDADGVVIWDNLPQPTLADHFQDYFDDFIGPELERMTRFVIDQNPLREDLNGDGIVDTADLTYVLIRLGTDDMKADINTDGIVDAIDVIMVTRAFTG